MTIPPEEAFKERLGLHELLGFWPSWEFVDARLARLPLGFVLDILGRISMLLYHRPQQANAGVLTALFGDGSPVLKALHKAGPDSVTVFDEILTINATKRALMVCPRGRPLELDAPKILGTALLAVGGLIDREFVVAPAIARKPAGRSRSNAHLLANGLFNRPSVERHEEARAYLLYLRDHDDPRHSPFYMNLPQRLQNISGLDSITFLSILHSVSSLWRGRQQIALINTGSVFDRSHFQRSLSLSDDDLQQYLGVVSQSLDSAVATAHALHGAAEWSTYDRIYLAKHPVLDDGQRIYCPSVKLLSEKLTTGLHHVFLAPDNGLTEDQRKQFLDFMGAVFEKYVVDALPGAFQGTVMMERDLQIRQSDRVCDAAILSGSGLILLEVKAGLLPADAVAGRSWDVFRRKATQTVVEAAAQISATVDSVQSGALEGRGIARDVAPIIPLVVTLEHFPITPAMYDELDADIRGQGMLRQTNVLPWQLMNVSDLEVCEGWRAINEDPVQVVLKRALHRTGPKYPFSNYRWAHHPEVGEAFSPRLNVAWNEIVRLISGYNSGRP